jgi:3-phenylpropionate/cinnamic acid dioxygenase small subunit
MDIEELAAREAIRDLVARYNANADTGRFREVAELFARDAVMELPDRAFEGRAAIDGMFREVQSEYEAQSSSGGSTPHLRHFTSTLQIDLELPDRARSRCYFQVLTARGLDHWGRYVDEYVRQEGRWLFARRKASVDGRAEGSMFPS